MIKDVNAFNDIIPLDQILSQSKEEGQQNVGGRSVSEQLISAMKHGIFDDLRVGSGSIAFKTDSQGSWWGADQFVNAKAKVSMSGQATFTDIILTGGTLTFGKTSFSDNVNAGYVLSEDGFYIGSENDGVYLKFSLDTGVLDFKGGSVSDSEIQNVAIGTDISLLGWQSTVIFSSPSYNRIDWTSGTITLSNGESFAVDAGSVTSIAALRYIYIDKDIFTTALSSTATAANAVGRNKLLIAVVEPNSDHASQANFQVFGGSGGVFLKAGQIAANAITANEIAANSISTAKLQANAVTANEIAAGAIIADKIGAGAVIAGKIAANAVTATEIAAGSIDASKIVANTITAGQIAAGTITATEIANTTITGSKIVNSTITGSKIAANTITADKINVTSLSAITADLGTITAGSLDSVTITSGNITLPRSAVGGSTGYLKWQDNNSKIWVDTNQDMGIRANGGQIYMYGGATEIAVFQSAGQALLRKGLEVTGNINVKGSGAIRIEDITDSLFFGTGSNSWVDADGLSGTTGTFRTNLSGRLQVSTHLDPASAACNLGGSTRYWGEIHYKTLHDEGCLGWFDEGVELQDGRIVSDTDSLLAIQKHPTKKTIYGAPMLDYSTFPKVALRKAKDNDGNELPRDENDVPYVEEEEEVIEIDKKTGKKVRKIKMVKKELGDNIEMTSVFSIMIGAIKELTLRVKDLEGQLLVKK